MKKILYCIVILFTPLLLYGQTIYDQTSLQINVSYSESPFAITLSWEMTGFTEYKIYKKHPYKRNWDSVYAVTSYSNKTFIDSNVEKGKIYEYGVEGVSENNSNSFGYILAGQEVHSDGQRGTVILLVDSTFTNSLASEIATLESDLVGAGWKIKRKDINRSTSPQYVKNVIQTIYNADTANVNTVFILGHIPLALSGSINPDAHGEQPFPAEMYYGDVIDGDQWTYDYGDGTFQQNMIPGINNKIDLAVGRVDLYDLPAFSESEEELLRRYLKKDHEFRHKIINPPMRGLIEDNFGPTYWEMFGSSGYRPFYNLIGKENVKDIEFYSLRLHEYLFSFGCGSGSNESCGGGGDDDDGVVTTTDYTTYPYYSVFNSLFGSGFVRWDKGNNLMRASLANEGYALTCFWTGRPYLQFHQIGMDITIGDAIRIAQNNTTNGPYVYNSYAGYIHPALLGDPTLCMYNIWPVADITSVSNQGDVTLYWKESNDEVEGYYVYRYSDVEEEYEQISDLLTFNAFTDTNAYSGDNQYMIRAYGKIESRTGSFYKMSQGIFYTVDADVNETITAITDITLSTVGGTSEITQNNGTLQILDDVLPDSATVPTLNWSVENNSGMAAINSDGELQAIDNGTVTVKAEAIDGSGISDEITITISNQVNLIEDIIISRANGETTLSINEGPVQLQADIIPSYASNQDIDWNVVNKKGEATIDDDGKITGIRTGSVDIYAITNDGSDVYSMVSFLITDEPGPPNTINEQKNQPVIYPNPVKNLFNVTKITPGTRIEIHNMMGQTIISEVAKKVTHKINMSGQSPGVYLITFYTKESRIIKKFILK